MKKDLLKAIRAKCLDCCMGQSNEVKLCPVADCPLYPYRFGKDPWPTSAKAYQRYFESLSADDSFLPEKGAEASYTTEELSSENRDPVSTKMEAEDETE